MRDVARYRPLATFTAPVAAQRQPLWRPLLGAVAVVVLYLAFLFALGIFLQQRYGTLLAAGIAQAMLRATTPGAALLLLYSFTGMALAVLVTVRLIHGRSAATLFGDRRAAIADVLAAARAVLVVTLAVLLLALATERPDPGLRLATFLLYLPAALLGILVQVTAEELVFRGYLMQELAARFRSPLVWAGLSSLLFGLGHYQPGAYGANAWPIVLWATLFGLAAADLTARTGTLGAAIGLHFANNLAAFLFIGVRGDMDGLALWTRTIDLASPADVLPILIVDFATILLAWLAVRLALRV
ncbi:type II CAAX endopeptidase family protein [Frigidibacter sp. SD6-1]|uniref:CPBP family intramembrane glutamic endopeptidase n=1 Tax=Frigidibacter sp. SD6-1 TaxID=3032581 RepID=UPI0024E022D3|nr:type II CAAX endopeptidase family protein [Frigidibacter sp. SD6-1]